MERKLGMPIINRTLSRAGMEKTVAKLKELKLDYACFGLGPFLVDKEAREEEFATLRKNIKYFKEQGFQVFVWKWSFMLKGENDFEKVTNHMGNEYPAFACASDEKFVSFAAEYFQEIAKMGPDLILLDDDYRFGRLGPGAACFCDDHLKMTAEKLGEPVTREFLAEKVLKGEPNKYREAWLSAKGESLENYARVLRAAIDRVNPDIRMGLCACMSTWLGDGTDCIKICNLLAGKTKPFMRFIGAPYWAVNRSFGGNRLQDVIEMERMQGAWCENEGIETFNEGDPYPRPRYACPASYLELFDIALIADGKSDGIIKYMLDYFGSVDYETGYLLYHFDNAHLREEIHNLFSDKKPVGVRVFETLDKFDKADFSETEIEVDYMNDMFFSLGATLLSTSSIPTHYENDDSVTLIFGENIKSYDYENQKAPLILDVVAAEYLRKQGVDTGLVSVQNNFAGEVFGCSTNFEFYDPVENEYSSAIGLKAKKLELVQGCNPELYYNLDGEKQPAAYTYTNKAGQSFLVFAFDSRYTTKNSLRNYLLQNALIRGIEKISGKLPAVCPKNPDLYIMTKQKDNTLAVGLWNFFADKVLQKEITLAREIKSVRFINCEGSYEKNVVKLKELMPFNMAAFEVTFK